MSKHYFIHELYSFSLYYIYSFVSLIICSFDLWFYNIYSFLVLFFLPHDKLSQIFFYINCFLLWVSLLSFSAGFMYFSALNIPPLHINRFVFVWNSVFCFVSLIIIKVVLVTNKKCCEKSFRISNLCFSTYVYIYCSDLFTTSDLLFYIFFCAMIVFLLTLNYIFSMNFRLLCSVLLLLLHNSDC